MRLAPNDYILNYSSYLIPRWWLIEKSRWRQAGTRRVQARMAYSISSLVGRRDE